MLASGLTPGRGSEIVRIRPEKISLVRRATGKAAKLVRQWRWRMRLQSLGARSDIASPAWICGGESICIGRGVSIWRFARIEALNAEHGITRIAIGDGAAIQPFFHIGAVKSVTIGRHCLIASHVYITDHDHDFSNPEEPPIVNDRAVVAPVEIGDYAWLGERVMVLKGVRIGERSVIGAGSIVTRDVPAYSIAVGSPARVIRTWNPLTGQWEAAKPT
jgi:lipopolysaccharide O-acetyltransferase